MTDRIPCPHCGNTSDIGLLIGPQTNECPHCGERALYPHTLAAIDTRADMLDALYLALPFVEDHEQSDIYKTGAVSRALNTIRAAIKQAETL
jgi:DNA-directed RNA polymerase subunit RPC12/RpoP